MYIYVYIYIYIYIYIGGAGEGDAGRLMFKVNKVRRQNASEKNPLIPQAPPICSIKAHFKLF